MIHLIANSIWQPGLQGDTDGELKLLQNALAFSLLVVAIFVM